MKSPHPIPSSNNRPIVLKSSRLAAHIRTSYLKQLEALDVKRVFFVLSKSLARSLSVVDDLKKSSLIQSKLAGVKVLQCDWPSEGSLGDAIWGRQLRQNETIIMKHVSQSPNSRKFSFECKQNLKSGLLVSTTIRAIAHADR